MTVLPDPLQDEAFRVFPAWQDLVARVMPFGSDPLAVQPVLVFEALNELAETDDRATERLCHLMIANGYADTIFEAGALIGRLYGMSAIGRRPRYAPELGLAS